jgi:HEAT repeat protein
MWMLYFIVQKTGTVPSGAGSAFREFTQSYERGAKDDAPVSDESRRWWSRLLEHLAFEMMQAEKPTDFRLTISKRQAEDILTKVLDREKFDKPRDRALRWLEDLLKHHLIQVTSNDQIEFCHQLIQEYYAAERLLKVWPPPTPLVKGGARDSDYSSPLSNRSFSEEGLRGVSDDELKREYLNYLKWTEPLALMLELVEDEAQAVRVVQLALEVDWQLGARLAGAVKLEFQEETVGLVAGLEIPQLLKIQLLGITQSEKAIPELVQALEDEDSFVRWNAAEALGHIGSETVVPQLIQLLEDEDSFVRMRATDILGHIGSEVITPQIVKLRKDKNNFVRNSAADALKRLDQKAVNSQLIQLQEDQNSSSPKNWTEALGQIYADLTISQLIELLEDKNSFVQIRAAEALGEIGAEVAVPHLIKLLKTSPMGSVPWFVAKALGKINSASIIPQLMPLLEHGIIVDYENMDVYCKNITVYINAAEALGELTSEAAIPQLIQLLENKLYMVRKFSAMALGKIGAEAAISQLIRLLEDENCEVRESAIKALGKIGAEVAIPQLIKLLKNVEDEDFWAANLPIQMLDAESKDWSAAEQDVRRLYYHATEAVLAIQNRCKFYNYTITVSPSPQEENNPESLTADLQQYEEILSVLSNMVTVMERNPKTFGRIEEEALRDHFLVQLNGKYKGQATGETFNKKGKTDILIRVDGENIFIAECKFWSGGKKLKETLDQLLGYTTWRDTKLALLIFNRNKNFSEVLKQISAVMKNHPTFTQELSYPSETGFRFILHHPEDKNRELLLTVLAFEIPRSH